MDDDDLDTEEAELADRMHISSDRWRKLAVFAVVMALMTYAAITYMQRRDDREDQAAAEEEHHEEGITPAVTTTFATGEATNPIEPECPEAPYDRRVVQFNGPPPTCIDDGTTYVATVETTRGDFEIELDSQAAPITVNNFVFLARWRYYEGAGFHRVVQDFLLQTGDPIGPTPGVGGPGYTIPDELPTTEPFYPTMSVGMTHAPGEADANGGRFFVVLGRGGEAQDPEYTRFGTVTDGEDVVRAIEATGNAQGNIPQDLTVIEGITIDER